MITIIIIIRDVHKAAAHTAVKILGSCALTWNNIADSRWAKPRANATPPMSPAMVTARALRRNWPMMRLADAPNA